MSAVDTVMSSVARIMAVMVVAVMPVTVVGVMSGLRRRCDKAGDRPHSSADGGAERCTVAAGGGSPDCGPAACADETASDHALNRIVWVGASRQA